MVYESLLVCGVLFFAGVLYFALAGSALAGWRRHAFQLFLFLVLGLYFAGSWRRGGQTLAMKTWRLRVVGANGARVSWRQALLRYAWAWPCLAFGGIGILYALFDRERQFLHDRLARTRLVLERAARKS